MTSYSTDTVCGITGTLPSTLRNWRRAGLINKPEFADGYSSGQLTRIYTILALTSSGDTLREVSTQLNDKGNARHSGWECRQEELIDQLNQPDSLLDGCIRQMGGDYSGDDFVNSCLKPLNLWLRADIREGAEMRIERFHEAVMLHTRNMTAAAYRRKSVPLFLEAISVTDPTEIWMEAIRLTGQGFRVELSAEATGLPATSLLRHDHHLMWCGEGICQLMKWNYQEKLRNDKPVRLCGPDQVLLPIPDYVYPDQSLLPAA